jgi:hypothetical protein
MVLLALLYLGRREAEPPLAIASVAVGLAVLSFAVVVWRSTGALAESKAG